MPSSRRNWRGFSSGSSSGLLLEKLPVEVGVSGANSMGSHGRYLYLSDFYLVYCSSKQIVASELKNKYKTIGVLFSVAKC